MERRGPGAFWGAAQDQQVGLVGGHVSWPLSSFEDLAWALVTHGNVLPVLGRPEGDTGIHKQNLKFQKKMREALTGLLFLLLFVVFAFFYYYFV